MKYLLILLFAMTLLSCSKEKVDLIIFNAHIYKANEASDTANVLVIHNGKFVAVGSTHLLNKYVGDNVIDAAGRYIYPGFMDAHCHFTGYAMDKYKLGLFGTHSFREVLDKILIYAQTNQRQWIEGRGWDQNDWDLKEFPVKDTLDKLFPDTPVFLMRIDGHAVLCNQKALDLAGITAATKVAGGEIILKKGKPTGLLVDNAVDLVKKVLPARSAEEIIRDFVSAQQDCIELGLTSVVDCGIKRTTVEHLQLAYKQEKLFIKTTVMLSDDADNFEAYLSQKPYRDNLFHIAGFKVYADGALGSRGAYLLEAYSDRHDHRGLLLTSVDSMTRIAEKILTSGYQLCTHAIGDAANREVLKLYAAVLKGKNDRRWRIEHAQVVNEKDFHYFGDFNIIPSVQPTHATSDMYWAKDRLGDTRITNAYAYRKLLDQNHWLPLGTDFPVEELNPLNTFSAAVFRVDKKNYPEHGFQIENALTPAEALKGITLWAARSVFEEDTKGSIEPGKAADFVIMNVDLMKQDPASIYNLKIEETYIDGVRRYNAKEKQK